MTVQPGSSSIEQPEYWWYRARTGLLEAALGRYLGHPERVLDVGSADGPSVDWMRGEHQRVAIDMDPRGLTPGQDVCASALHLPFGEGSFDVVGAFDVIEHCDHEHEAVSELHRVLRPGGRLLASVPAYTWAWTDHDVRAGHYRRYTRPRLIRAVERAGFRVLHCGYGFTGVFPMFAAQRGVQRLQERRRGGEPDLSPGLPSVSPTQDRILMGLSDLERRAHARGTRLPFGSSVFLAAEKPA